MTEEEKSKLCIQCGNCCKYFVLEIPKPPRNVLDPEKELNQMMEWLQARGVKILKVKEKVLRIKIDSPCPHLFSPNPQSFYCDIYDRRPEVCRRFDGRIDGEKDLICLWKGK